MLKGEFKVKSLEAIDTINQDLDVGVIRVSGCRLQELGSRNSLVRISTIENGPKAKSLIRIVRAKTGKLALQKNEIALQYDDRIALGINKADESRILSIKPVQQWLNLPCFLLFHTSPLVRKEAGFALALLVLGFFLGLFVPSPFN
ncbi:MAG: hypothetical protein OXF88_18295 [Rhodobacteraceae bacterium]|nr:hypothetical protein [Paracoccaceae bacterium]MCY4139108.1 hypothetical protein [Paracoccaceae bacterium]